MHIITIKNCANIHTHHPDQAPGQGAPAGAIDGLYITCHREEELNSFYIETSRSNVRAWGSGRGYLRGSIFPDREVATMRYKSIFKKALSVAALVLIFGAAASDLWAQEFDEAFIFFELNDTDGDLGIHALIDGDAWDKLNIKDPDGRRILDVKLKGNLGNQGLTEFFFESAEPLFEDLDPVDFFDRFPEGIYEIEGRSVDGEEMEAESELTHVMPAPPAPTVNGESMAVQCDDEEPGFDITVTSAPVTIAWPAVTMSHPDPDTGGAGIFPPVAVEIYNYQVVVETELEIDGEEFETVFSVILPPGVTSMEIPDEFIAQSDTFKYEVLAREESFNQTAVESCFMLVE